ncbi:MAG: hypothetical protein WC356_06910 [Candidatus Micrarchaeia archaeon]|jgi:hypothetical protein
MKIDILITIFILFIVFSFCGAHTINDLGPGEIEVILNPNEVHTGCIQILDEGEIFNNYKRIVDEGKERILYNYYIDLSPIDAQISDTIYVNLRTGPSMSDGRILLNNYQICNSGYCKNMQITAAKAIFNFEKEHFKHILSYIENQPLRMIVTDMDLCVFYPELEINIEELPINVTDKMNITLKGKIININQIDANKVTLKLNSEDFNVKSNYFKFDLTGNYNLEESVKSFEFTLTPKNLNVENKVLNGIYYGTLSYSFKDTQGITRTKSLDLGKASFSIIKEEIEEPQIIEVKEQKNNNIEENNFFSLIIGVLVILIFVLIGIIYLGFIKQKAKK